MEKKLGIGETKVSTSKGPLVLMTLQSCKKFHKAGPDTEKERPAILQTSDQFVLD